MARLKSHFEFIAGMYIGGETFFNKYSLGIDFYTTEDNTPHDQNIAMDRISYFIYDAVTRCIFIQEDDIKQIEKFNKAGLSVLTVPEPGPFDPVVLATLVTKMNAIVEDVLVITEAELVSDMSGPLVYIWDSADDDDEIHGMVSDEDEAKWWASPAPRFGSYPAGSDVDEIEETQPFPLSWEMLNLEWHEEESEEDKSKFIVDVVTKPSGKNVGTVIKADFTGNDKPKKKK